MYLSLKGSLGHTPITDRVGEGPLQIAEGAAAAYSLRNLGSDSPSVVRVRRESDNNERDFTAQDISTSVLTNWVNQQITPPLDLRELTATGRDGPIIEAAAAYSLRNLSDSYTGSVVDVRRSSDGNTAPFTAAEVTDGTLEAWVAEEQVGWNVQPTWDVVNGDGVITSQSKTATTSTFSITTTSGASFVRQSSKPNHVIASSGDQVVANITLSGFDAAVSARLRTAGTNIDVAQQTLSNGTADYTFNLTGSGGYFALVNLEATSGATLTFNSIKVIGKSGYVSKWYDQSTTSGVPNANHAVQTDAASQPKIVSGGSLVTGGLDFDGTSDFFQASIGTLTQPISGFSVFKNNSLLNSPEIWDSISLTNRVVSFAVASDDTFRISAGVAISSASSSQVDGTTYLRSDLINTTASEGYVNGTLKMSGNAGTNSMEGLTIGARYDGSINFTNGSIAELIIYNSDQSDNRTALEANIGETYGIAGIPAYDNTVNGFVETWYDQSGNGNNATQLTASKQPKIVDAGVLVSGGLDFDGVDDNLDATGATTADGTKDTSIIVGKVNSTSTTYSFLDNVGPAASAHFIAGADTGSFAGYFGVSADFSYATSNTDENLHFIYKSNVSNQSTGSLNGVVNPLDAGTDGYTGGVRIGASRLLSSFLDGTVKEVIIYASDQSANRAAIETNINNQYDIY